MSKTNACQKRRSLTLDMNMFVLTENDNEYHIYVASKRKEIFDSNSMRFFKVNRDQSFEKQQFQNNDEIFLRRNHLST